MTGNFFFNIAEIVIFFLNFIIRAYKSANPDHLFKALDTAAHKTPGVIDDLVNVKDIMDSWSLQKGFPILNVNYDPEIGTLNIKQQRYLTNNINDPEMQKWWIPYNFITQSEASQSKDTKPDDWIFDSNIVIYSSPNRDLKSKKWILFNKKQTGFYRINYDDNNWNALADALMEDDFDNIPMLNRAQLIDDSLDFARTRRLSYEIPLKLLTYLGKSEIEYFPWASANYQLGLIRNRIMYSSFSQNFLVNIFLLFSLYFYIISNYFLVIHEITNKKII